MDRDATAERWRRSWRDDGYVIVRSMFTRDEAAELLAVARAAQPLVDGPNELTLGSMEFRSNIFQHSPALQGVLSDLRTVELLTALLGDDVWCRWDQAVAKRPGAGWFPWHQDNGYSQLPDVHLQLWIALTPSNASNGGLLIAPGRHLEPLPHTWVGAHVETDPGPDQLLVEAEPGDAVAFSSLLPHATGPNTSDTDRWAYVAEFLPLRSGDPAVGPPHFVVARGGTPAAEFDDLSASWAATPPVPGD